MGKAQWMSRGAPAGPPNPWTGDQRHAGPAVVSWGDPDHDPDMVVHTSRTDCSLVVDFSWLCPLSWLVSEVSRDHISVTWLVTPAATRGSVVWFDLSLILGTGISDFWIWRHWCVFAVCKPCVCRFLKFPMHDLTQGTAKLLTRN